MSHTVEILSVGTELLLGNIANTNDKHYEYQAGIYYMDLVANLEKTGDYIINVVDTIKELMRQTAA